MKIKAKVKKIFIVIVCIYPIFILMQITTFAIYNVLTPSMEPAIKPGDKILIFKWIAGGRLYNPFTSGEIYREKIYRLPGFRKFTHNDIVVFNYPIIKDKHGNHIGLKTNTFYVKRIVATPGDTFKIRNAIFENSNFQGSIGNIGAQKYLNDIDTTGIPKLVKAYNGIESYDKSKTKWTIYNFGPLLIPNKGREIVMNKNNFKIYSKIIEWESNKKINYRNDGVYLDKKKIRHYIFKENYYFVAGDNLLRSKDSRYWGFLPEKFIVGKAIIILSSKNPYTKKIKWERFFKSL